MSELDDRLNEGRDTVATMDPPDDLWARVVERTNNHDAGVCDLTIAPGPRHPPLWLTVAAVAACLVAVVAIAVVVKAGRQSVHTVPPAESPTTECSSTTQPRAITQGAQMNKRFAAPVASAVAAIVMLSACGDDDASSTNTTISDQTTGPTTLAKGEDVTFVGGAPGLSDQTLDITAEEENGEVTGEARFSPAELILDLECADTDTEGLVVIGGEATADAGDGSAQGDRVAVIIREGSPDGVIIWFEQPLPDGEEAAGSCDEFLDAIPPDEINEEALFADVANGDDIETG